MVFSTQASAYKEPVITSNNIPLFTFFLHIFHLPEEKRSHLLHFSLPATGVVASPAVPCLHLRRHVPFRVPPVSVSPCAGALRRGPGRMLTEDRRCDSFYWHPLR